MQGCSKDPALT